MRRARRLLLLAALGLVVGACDEEPGREPPVPAWAHVAPEQVAEAAKHGVPVAFENEVGMRFVLIPAGTWRMGATVEEQRAAAPHVTLAYDNETQHEVTITKPFYLQVTEVTNGAWRRVFPDHHVTVSPDLLRLGEAWAALPVDADDHPVCQVSHDDVVHFARRLTLVDRPRTYRLPTEAEWEYACRAGTLTPRYWGDEDVTQHANAADAALKRAVAGHRSWTERRPGWPIPDSSLWSPGDDGFVMTAPVGSFPPNPWGLLDMLGNGEEWCADWYGPYPKTHVWDPRGVGPAEAVRPRFPRIPGSAEPPPFPDPPQTMPRPRPRPKRIVRGGSWCTPPLPRAASRGAARPDSATDTIGLRLVSPLPRTAR